MKKIILSIPDETMTRVEKAFHQHYGLTGPGGETPLQVVKRGLKSYMKSIVQIYEEQEAAEEARNKSDDLGL